MGGVANRRVFWAAVWLAIVLIAVKAYYLGLPSPGVLAGALDYLRSLAAISYVDVLFAAVVWACGRGLLALAADRHGAGRVLTLGVVFFGALSCAYAVANVIAFGVLGRFLTYPLLALIGSVRMLRSSVATELTPRVSAAIVGLPLAYLALVETTIHLMPRRARSWRPPSRLAFASLGVWVFLGQYSFSTEWATRDDRRIAENPHWVMLSSWWQAVSADGTVRMDDRFPAGDLSDFEPLGQRAPLGAAVFRSISTTGAKMRATSTERSPNVILIVLESIAARWASLNGGLYDTTPNLKAESAHGLVADNFYAHVGRSSNSLAAILLSTYPKLGFRDVTEEYPKLPGTSLAAVFRDRGYRTAFVTPSDLTWAGWGAFLGQRGFEQLRDQHDVSCGPPISSWGVEDRCMVEGMIDFIKQAPARPFFLMGWTTQTHHPYEPTPGMPLIDMKREAVPDQYELDRYLNVLRETDRHLEELFETIRAMGLDEDTLIVVVGDHGQSFGYPHDTYIQGRTAYEEDVHVPLVFWFPRKFRSPMRSSVVGSQVDLAPTITDLTGLPAAAEWQGRSLFDTTHPSRAYFYVAEDHFTLGIREERWKYTFDLREGIEELYDLDRDPDERHNLATVEPQRCARLRQRLAAWTEANWRQYGHRIKD